MVKLTCFVELAEAVLEMCLAYRGSRKPLRPTETSRCLPLDRALVAGQRTYFARDERSHEGGVSNAQAQLQNRLSELYKTTETTADATRNTHSGAASNSTPNGTNRYSLRDPSYIPRKSTAAVWSRSVGTGQRRPHSTRGPVSPADPLVRPRASRGCALRCS